MRQDSRGESNDSDPGGPSRLGTRIILPLLVACAVAVPLVAASPEPFGPPTGVSALEVLIFFALLVCSSVLSGSESALTAVNAVRVRTEAEAGHKLAAVVAKLLKDRSRLISALLIGNNIVNAALTTFATVVFANAFSDVLGPAGAAAAAASTSVVFLVIFGEVLPKTIAVNLPLQFSYAVAWPVFVLLILLWPLTLLLAGLQRLSLKLVRHDPDGHTVTGAEIEAMGRLAEGQGILAEGSSDTIANILALQEKYVREVITPRIDVVGLPADAGYQQTIEAFRANRFSRLPVYNGDLDDIVGVLTIRDVLGLTEEEQANFRAHLSARRALFVPELKRVGELIIELRNQRNHFAVVVDEFGGTTGVVTLEDLLETLVGQIEDEFDEGSPRVRQIGSGLLLVDGGVKITDLERFMRRSLPEIEGVDTVAGMFLARSESIPNDGDSVDIGPIQLVVRRMREGRIERLLVREIADE